MSARRADGAGDRRSFTGCAPDSDRSCRGRLQCFVLRLGCLSGWHGPGHGVDAWPWAPVSPTITPGHCSEGVRLMSLTSSARALRQRIFWLGMLLIGLGGLGLTLPAGAGGVVNASSFTGTAIEGYDPVAYFTEGRPVEGASAFSHDWMGADLVLRQRREPGSIRRRTGEVRAPVRRLLRLGGRARLHRQDRSRGLEDRRRQAVPELLQGRAGRLGRGHPRQHQQGGRQLAEDPRRPRRVIRSEP